VVPADIFPAAIRRWRNEGIAGTGNRYSSKNQLVAEKVTGAFGGSYNWQLQSQSTC